jgi:VWFA-related protein
MPRVALVALTAVVLVGTVAFGQQQPTFRAATDLVVIEVVAVGRDGLPIAGLTQDQFQVTFDGRRRDVVSADLVRVASLPGVAGAPDASATPVPAVESPEGRLIVIAVDEHSIPPGAQASAREAVTRIVDRASPADTLALVTFPGAVAVGPTRDHNAVRAAITRVGGYRVDAPQTRFNLSASEAVQVRSRESVTTAEVIQRMCAVTDPTCAQEVREAASTIAHTLEQQGVATIDALHGVLDHLQAVDGRKHLFVVSAGLPTTTVSGGQPNLTAATESVARRAAAANVNLYVFYLNVHFLQHFSAATGWRSPTNLYQDINLFGSGLERFADSAGGAFFQVEVDSDPFVDRAFRETSAFYRLGVRPDPSDAGARPRTIRVTVRQSGVTLRYRRIIEIPASTGR